MKKVLVGAVLVSLLVPAFASAVSLSPAEGKYGLVEVKDNAGTVVHDKVAGEEYPAGVIGKVVGIFLSFLAIIFFILGLYAGTLWMTARGDSAKVDKAKGILEDAIVGIIIVVGAYAIVNYAFTFLIPA